MLTKKQLDLLDFIQTRTAKDGVPPSFDEMKEALDLRSKSGIHRLITALEERGFIRRLPHRARALEIVKLPDALADKHRGFVPRVIDGDKSDAPLPLRSLPIESAAHELPIMGRIAAGTPMEALQQGSNHVAVPGQMIEAGGLHYAMEGKCDSMIEAGINDGDVVVIREQRTAENGDIVVALVEGDEATLKRYRRKNGMIALEAANPAYETRLLNEDQVTVQGRLVGLIRTY